MTPPPSKAKTKRATTQRAQPLAHPSTLTLWLLLGACLQVSACGPKKESQIPPTVAKPLEGSQVEKEGDKEEKPEAVAEEYKGPVRDWARTTYSPQPGSTPDPDLEPVAETCGTGDSALHAAAQLMAEFHATEGDAPSLDVARFHMRRLGSPYVMPRLWSATMKNVTVEQVASNVKEWAHVRPALGEHRCGVGLYAGKEGEITVSALQVDVLAEMKPIPTKVSSGKWLDLEAAFLNPTSSATVLLLPPVGPPKRLNTRIKGHEATARFAIETPGTWLIQLMATQSGGPRPVAEMWVTADEAPPQAPDSRPVPGEDAFDPELRPADALFALINAAREDQGLPAVKRNRELDQVARAHSEAMMKQGRISHDTGAGDPAHRVDIAGLTPKATGENVALAATVVRLHRVLWASPAHRENLLLRRWDEVGVSVSSREDGTLFATELFIDSD